MGAVTQPLTNSNKVGEKLLYNPHDKKTNFNNTINATTSSSAALPSLQKSNIANIASTANFNTKSYVELSKTQLNR